jgi:hypothetical protein
MDKFNITGRELASALHVDYTLVSKWRNLTRTLAPRSIHLKKIVEYFVALDSKTQYSTLLELLMETYPNAQLKSDTEISMFLSKWLSDKEEKLENDEISLGFFHMKNVSKGQFYIFKDSIGRRDAVTKFLDTALSSSPEGKEMLLFSQENPLWFSEDESFLDVWREKNLEFLNHGGKIRVIHTVDRLYKSIADSLIKWLPLHMTGSTRSYYFPQFIDSPLKMTLYILKDTAVIFGMTTEGLTRTNYTYLCYDPIMIQQCQFVFQSLLSRSLPLFEKFMLNQSEKMLNIWLKADESKENSYIIATPPLITIMSRELIRKILVENNLNEEAIGPFLESHAKMQETFYVNSVKNHYRFIYDLNKLEETLESDEIVFNALSLLVGKRIIISHEELCQSIQEMLTCSNKVKNLEFALLDGPPAVGMKNINFWVKENTISVSSSILQHTDTPFSLFTNELTAVNPCYHYLNQLWNAIPQIKRDKNWVKQKLYHMISRFKY